jgi:SAM-dependent methyltransferase
MSRAAVFGRIYRTNAWNGRESRSGPGSGREPTREPSRWLLGLIQDHSVRAVLDIGCGDGFWMPDLPGYLGVDVAQEAVDRAKRLHPGRAFQVWDACLSLPPGDWDLVLCRDVLQHLPLADGQALLENVRRSRARLLVASTYDSPSERHGDPLNVDIRPGDCYSPDLTRKPFSLPEPLEVFPDGWDYQDGSQGRDHAKYLGAWAVPW